MEQILLIMEEVIRIVDLYSRIIKLIFHQFTAALIKVKQNSLIQP